MYATFLLRIKAFLLDYILMFGYLVLLLVENVFIFPSLQELFNGSLAVAQLTGFIMVTLPISVYFVISDSTVGGQSFGKRKTAIQVVNQNGNALSVPHAIFRTILKFLPWELSHYLVYRLVHVGEGAVPVQYYVIGGLIYALMFTYIFTAIFTKRKQSLYDLLAKTQVVKRAG
ncbi:RDD family protein [Paenibacillus xylanilyticus]|uniref:RDD family protein n=1 Tax=Paenibacillus xylanilyticus TaxID=248903 RepID=A0A7Y6EWU1_9BACL|nr:RDD family protein [Paenibacillus xylanilyticus]NUU78146.1 RDD family protein [Paenibacillus xylanilyticus]